MKNYRFYAEMPEGRGSKSASKNYGPFTRKTLEGVAARGLYHNVVAVLLDQDGQPLWQRPAFSVQLSNFMDAIAPVNDRSNAAVESCSVEQGYLHQRCVRISADLAKKLHPNLFIYLERP